MKGSAIFINIRRRKHAKYDLKLRYLSTKNFTEMRSSLHPFNVVLGKKGLKAAGHGFFTKLLHEGLDSDGKIEVDGVYQFTK